MGLLQFLRAYYYNASLLTYRYQDLPCRVIRRLIYLERNTSTKCHFGAELGRSDFSYFKLHDLSWDIKSRTILCKMFGDIYPPVLLDDALALEMTSS